MLNYKVGNLIDAALACEIEAIAQCCNCFCTMKSGIAPQIVEAFPKTLEADNATRAGSWDKFGDYSRAFDRGIFIYNLYGQYRYAPRNMRHLHYDALTLALRGMASDLTKKGIVKVGLPKIGAGLAGGHWPTIERIIEKTLFNFNVTIYVLDEKEIP